MSLVAQQLSRAIREGLWIDIRYKQSDKVTHYWIGINDIDPHNQVIFCDIFNVSDTASHISNTKIYFSKIISARVIDNTIFAVNQALIDNIETFPGLYQFLEYEVYKQNVLDYYVECFKEDTTPFQTLYKTISKIDQDVLTAQKYYQLDESQLKEIIKLITKNLDMHEKEGEVIYKELCINLLGIEKDQRIFSVVYQTILLDLSNRKIVLQPELRFSSEFMYDSNRKYSFRNYFSFDIQEFINNFESNRIEYSNILSENVGRGEKVDTSPYIFEMHKRLFINLEKEYESIKELELTNSLPLPLKAFFGGVVKRTYRNKKHPIFLFDNRVNINQLRVLYSSINNPITYVQGPPGTGKTQTIMNVVLSSLLNGRTALVVSNNNGPIDSIYERLLSLHFQEQKVLFPVIRLGNTDSIKQAICDLNKNYYMITNHIKSSPVAVTNDQLRSLSQDESLAEMLSSYDEAEVLKEEISALEALGNRAKETMQYTKVAARVEALKTILSKIGILENDELVSKLSCDTTGLMEYLYNLGFNSYLSLDLDRFYSLKAVLIYPENTEITNKEAIKFRKYISSESGMRNLLSIFPVVLSTNLSSNYLGPSNPNFDLVIMDEAGQCNPATALLPIIRGKRLLLVGDTNQLQPIVSLDKNYNEKLMNIYRVPKHYSYFENSILNTMLMADSVSKYILLQYHYRCSKRIIGFSNKKFYDNSLIIMTPDNDQALKLKHVESGPQEKNCSIEEVASVINEIKTSKYKDIGVITPFRKQAEEISRRLAEFGHSDISVGTVHTFQGEEKEKIIFSLAVTESTYDKTFDWVKDNRELINVATTRAKNELVLICDTKQIISRSRGANPNSIYELMKYMKYHGVYELNDDSPEIFKFIMRRGKKLNTDFEQEFLETIEHIFTINTAYKIETKKRMADVLNAVGIAKEHMDYFLKAHFDFVIYDKATNYPVLAIEVNGSDHYSQSVVAKRDEIKKSICIQQKMTLLIVPNNYVRRYDLIKNELIKILK